MKRIAPPAPSTPLVSEAARVTSPTPTDGRSSTPGMLPATLPSSRAAAARPRSRPASSTLVSVVVEYRVGPLDLIPERGGILAVAGDVEVGVFRLDGELRAYENRCRHQGGPVC